MTCGSSAPDEVGVSRSEAAAQRLNERDEQIMALQDELDAYDRHQKELEEKLDERTAALIHLQRVAMEHHVDGDDVIPAAARVLAITAAGDTAGAPGSTDVVLPGKGGVDAALGTPTSGVAVASTSMAWTPSTSCA